jgi:hypothetical protein
MHVHAQVEQRANKHVTADAAENIKVEGLHNIPFASATCHEPAH